MAKLKLMLLTSPDVIADVMSAHYYTSDTKSTLYKLLKNLSLELADHLGENVMGVPLTPEKIIPGDTKIWTREYGQITAADYTMRTYRKWYNEELDAIKKLVQNICDGLTGAEPGLKDLRLKDQDVTQNLRLMENIRDNKVTTDLSLLSRTTLFGIYLPDNNELDIYTNMDTKNFVRKLEADPGLYLIMELEASPHVLE